MAATWAFEPSFSSTRRAKLEAVTAFDEIIEALAGSNEITEARVSEATDLGPSGCYRPSVQLTVEGDLFDAFFNSPRGYRALFLADPDEGQAANGRLLRRLEPKLSAAVVERCGESRLTYACIRNALRANSAKIWPDEQCLDFANVTRDLRIPQWDMWHWLAPGVGLWAPEGRHLMVFGAFIDPWGNEVVSKKKITRRFEIHECGFT
jgi:hypothetical protein